MSYRLANTSLVSVELNKYSPTEKLSVDQVRLPILRQYISAGQVSQGRPLFRRRGQCCATKVSRSEFPPPETPYTPSATASGHKASPPAGDNHRNFGPVSGAGLDKKFIVRLGGRSAPRKVLAEGTPPWTKYSFRDPPSPPTLAHVFRADGRNLFCWRACRRDSARRPHIIPGR